MSALAPSRIVLLGAPGAGKGTVAKVIKSELGLAHLSTGDMLRSAVKEGTPVGTQAKTFMDRGALVPDDVMVALIEERVSDADCKGTKGDVQFLLDGFPRTLPQADALADRGLGPHKVIYLNVPKEVVVARLSGRRTCLGCGTPYHIEHRPPQKAGVCDVCASELVHRSDDHETPIRKRLDAYQQMTAPLVGHYQDVLETIDGNQPPEVVANSVLYAIGASS